ncbi:hypothetical protein [Kurthia massiliensis]|uniref:hypothetical protein n=1 Tax=Kurthia massiliensis TaxID=1033739 RepID=UPI000288CD54|nr:hypothetical protein [Kurthia massiliensis]
MMFKKKLIATIAAFGVLLPSSFASAATISSATAYKPSHNYKYTVYDAYGYPNRNFTLTCKNSGTYNARCTNKSTIYTYNITKKSFEFYVNGDVPVVTPYYFPLSTGKTYYKTGYDGLSSYKYSYKVLATNMKKKVGKKTYYNVIQLKNNVDNSYTYIAKSHGIVLMTAPYNGKQTTVYSVTNYTKNNESKKGPCTYVITWGPFTIVLTSFRYLLICFDIH